MSSETPLPESASAPQQPSNRQVSAIRKPVMEWDVSRQEPAVCRTVCDQDWLCSEQLTLGKIVVSLQAGSKAMSLDPNRNPQSRQMSDALLRKRYA